MEKMVKKGITLLFLLSLFWSVFASEDLSDLDRLIGIAIERNPKIKAAEKEAEAFSRRIPQEGSLSDPIVGLGIKNLNPQRFTIGEEVMSGVQFKFSQRFPFPGKLKLREEVATKSYERKLQVLEAVRLDVIRELKEAYFQLFYVSRAIETFRSQKEILETARSLTEAKYESGKGAQSDLFKAQIEIARIDEMTIPMKEMYRSIQAQINALLDYPLNGPIESPIVREIDTLEVSLPELQSTLSERSPILKEADLTISENDKVLELSKKDSYPNFVIEGGWDYKGRLDDMYEIMVGIEIPLYHKRKQRQKVEESLAQLAGSQNQFTSIRNDLSFRMTDYYLKAKASEALITLYQEKIIPKASLAVESSLSNYQVDRIDFLSLLTDINTLFSYQLVYFKELSQLWISIANLENMSATELVDW